MTITEFLLARIAEDEAQAHNVLVFRMNPRTNLPGNQAIPARVLAECAAKRAIIAQVDSWTHEYNDDDMWYSCGMAEDSWEENPEPGSGCSDESKRGICTCGLERRQLRILGPLAAVYADHPDYDPAWGLTG